MADEAIKRITPSSTVSVDMFYFALMENDELGSDGPTYKPSERLPGLISTNSNPNAQSAIQYADGGPFESAVQYGDITLSVGLVDVPNDIRAIWFGQEYENGQLLGTRLNPPNMAVGYRVEKARGVYRYIWLLKCRAAPFAETANTKGSSISFQTGTITITPVFPVSYHAFYNSVEDDDPNLPDGVTPAVIAENFFTSPLWKPEVVA